MACLNLPFIDDDISELMRKVREDDAEPIPSVYSDIITELVANLMMKDPDDRPNINEIL